MVEFTDPSTGEVPEPVGETVAEQSVLARMASEMERDYEPMTPEEIERRVFILGERLEIVGKVIVALYEAKHRAEEKYQLAYSKAIVKSPNAQISFAREYAKAYASDEFHEMNVAKEALRYAEEMQKSLQSKHYGYMNISKSVSASFGGNLMRGGGQFGG